VTFVMLSPFVRFRLIGCQSSLNVSDANKHGSCGAR
jgi:hypothetical protein